MKNHKIFTKNHTSQCAILREGIPNKGNTLRRIEYKQLIKKHITHFIVLHIAF